MAQSDGAEAPAVYVNKELLERLARGSGGASARTAPEPTEDLQLSPSGQLNSRLYVSPGQPAAPPQAPPAPEILAGELKALEKQSEASRPPLPRRKAEPPAEAGTPAEDAPAGTTQTAGAPAAEPAAPLEATAEPLADENSAPAPAELTRVVPPAEDPAPPLPTQATSESADAAPEPEAPPALDPGTTPPVAAAPAQSARAEDAVAPADAPAALAEEIPAPPDTEAPAAEAAGETADAAPPAPPQPSEILSALEQESEAVGKSAGTPPAPAVPDPPAPPEPAETAVSFDAAPPPPPPSALPSDDPEAEPPAPEAQLGAAEPAPQREPAQVAELTEGLAVLDETRLLFEGGSTELTPEARAQLERLAGLLKEAESDSLLLRAYASGRDARRVSLNRALVARAYLESLGISPKRVVLRPLGDKAVDGSKERVDIERLRR